ncbi:B3 domain-containing transcription factor VRN1 [Melia azedarach]|uniref:B3 domain-containing transcription factor VRN1 n=1 Tax=Melia azedarach TaxID=155640 RepID=A0ACC1XYD9_MELAZ|nr:B3 domain-containing transcription factor VRN1 [Melia azedarach]
MRIPPKFVRKFGHELSSAATLIIPNGRLWQVSLTKDGKNVWFNDGWHHFVEYHSISVGYFLVFKYKRNSSFHVFILDLTACEINYPYNVDDSQCDIEDENPVQITGFGNPEQPVFSLTSKHFDDCPSKEISSKMNTQLADQNRAKDTFDCAQRIIRNCRSAAFLENSKVKHRCELQRKNCETEEMLEIKERDDANENDLLAVLEEKGKCTGRRRTLIVSAEARKRAINIARTFKPNNASFMVILRSSSKHNLHVYIPAEFANKLLSEHAKSIKVQVPNERVWSLQIYKKYRGGF